MRKIGKSFAEFMEVEDFKSTRSHNAVMTSDLLDDFLNIDITESWDRLVKNLACELQRRTILKQMTADLRDPRWQIRNLEGTHTYTQEGKEIKITYPSGRSASIYILTVPLTRDGFIECEFADLEPGTTNGVFFTVDTRNYGKFYGLVAGQTFPSSMDPEGKKRIGEGWMGIMAYDIDTTHSTPKTLVWRDDIEPFGKFRLSRSSVYVKLHKDHRLIMAAEIPFYFESYYGGFYSFGYATKEPRFTIIKGLKCGNY